MTTHYIVKMKLQPKWQNGVLQRSLVEVQSGSVVLWKSPYRRSGVEDTWWPVERREGEERNYIPKYEGHRASRLIEIC